MCYLVVFDGYFGNWGVDFYCYGVYSSREKAEAASEELRKFAKGRLSSQALDLLNDFIKIIELPMDESLVPRHASYFDYSERIATSAHIGGHTE